MVVKEKMRDKIFYLLLASGVIAVALLGVAAYFADGKFGKDPCEMSYMYPLFMENWPPLMREKGQCEKTRYRVLRYFEGKVTSDFRNPKGYPVLFVPGHLGSFKQARSLGSQVGSDVTVYALDFLEHPAGLSGSLLRRQAEFVNDAAYAISKLHGDKPVVIVGHSMGAVAAWGSQHLPHKKPVEVSTFFAICAPLLRPILLSEKVMSDFYSDFALKSSNASSNMVLISLSCGRRDALVPSNLCIADQLLNDTSRVFQSPVSELSGFSVNHQSVLWCKQVSVRVASAVTKSATLWNMEPKARRNEIAKTLLRTSNEDIPDDRYEALRDKMIASESPLNVFMKPGKLNFFERVLSALVMSFRSSWTRLFAFAFSSACMLLVVSLKDAQDEMQTDAEAFVEEGLAEFSKTDKNRWRLADELRTLSIYRQLETIYEISPPLLPAFLALFAGQSLKDEGAWFLNTWLLIASHGLVQVVVLIVLSLRRAFKRFLPKLNMRRMAVVLAAYLLSIGALFLAFSPTAKSSAALGSYDAIHLVLCCVFVSTFVGSYLLMLWIALTWGRDDTKSGVKTRGARAEIRAMIALGLMHLLSVCDSLGCFLLVWDALMLTSPFFKHEMDAIVISAPNMNKFPPCKLRLDDQEIELILTNLVLMFPAIAFLLRATFLESQPRFVMKKGEWGDYEFERTSANQEISPLKPRNGSGGNSRRERSISNDGKKSKKSNLVRTEVELVPVKLKNGRDDHIERVADIEYDESEPSQLIEIGEDVVQVDTLKNTGEAEKSEEAEIIYIGREVNLQERRRRWIRNYNAEVQLQRILSRFPLGAVPPVLAGAYFIVQSQQLVWIFPAAALVFAVFTLKSFAFNHPSALAQDVLSVTRVQRGG